MQDVPHSLIFVDSQRRDVIAGLSGTTERSSHPPDVTHLFVVVSSKLQGTIAVSRERRGGTPQFIVGG